MVVGRRDIIVYREKQENLDILGMIVSVLQKFQNEVIFMHTFVHIVSVFIPNQLFSISQINYLYPMLFDKMRVPLRTF
jgi:hypothetical protein